MVRRMHLSTVGDRVFSVSASHACRIDLPQLVISVPSLPVLRTRLKTFSSCCPNFHDRKLPGAVAQRLERFGLAINWSRVQILLRATLRNNLGQVVHTYVPLSPSSITWYRSKGGDALAAGKVTAGLAESNGSLPPGG